MTQQRSLASQNCAWAPSARVGMALSLKSSENSAHPDIWPGRFHRFNPENRFSFFRVKRIIIYHYYYCYHYYYHYYYYHYYYISLLLLSSSSLLLLYIYHITFPFTRMNNRRIHTCHTTNLTFVESMSQVVSHCTFLAADLEGARQWIS